MITHFRTVPLGELATFKGGSAFPKKYQGLLWGDYPFIKVSDLSRSGNERNIFTAGNWVGLDSPLVKPSRVIPPGCSVFAKIGEGLRSERVRFTVQNTLIDNNLMAAIPIHGSSDPDFLYYLLQTLGLADLAVGSALPYLRQSDLEALPVSVPSIGAQRRIASVLKDLDNLVDTNQRLAGSLRDLCHALFQRCIATASDTRSLRGALQLRYGKALPARARRAGAIPVVGSAGVVDTHAEALVEGPGIVVGRKGSVGTVTWVSSDYFPIDTAFYVETNESLMFLYFSLLGAGLARMNTDSAVPGLNRDNALSVKVPWPSEARIREFETDVTPMWVAAEDLEGEAMSVRAARDALLPLLMSGRVLPGEVA